MTGSRLSAGHVGPVRRALGIPYPWAEALGWPVRFAFPAPLRRAHFTPLPPESSTFGAHEASASVAFLGDVMPTPPGVELDVDPGLKATFAEVDLVIVNSETPLAEASKCRGTRYQFESRAFARHTERLGARPERLLVSVANNHAEDRGSQALAETVRRIEAMGARVVGLHARTGHAQPVVVDVRGTRVGISAWTQWRNRPANGLPRPRIAEDIVGTDWREVRRNLGLQWLVGFPHWDLEFRHSPQESTRRLASALAGRGFDVLFGHHPHVIQGLEQIGRSIVLYSGGNAVPNDACAGRWPCRLSLVWVVRFPVEDALGIEYRVIPYLYERSGLQARVRPLSSQRVATSREKARFDAIFPRLPAPSRTT